MKMQHRMFLLGTTLLGTILLAACGVPRAAGQVAAAGALASAGAMPADDAAIRAALASQGDAWTHLASLLMDQEIGGISGVDPKFTALVIQTAALARREANLIAQGLDDPAQNRETLAKLRQLWAMTNQYLNP